MCIRDRDVLRLRLEEQEGHHLLRVGQFKRVWRLDAHAALGEGEREVEAARLAVINDDCLLYTSRCV